MKFVSGKTLPRINRVNTLKRKNFLRAPVPMVSSSEAERSIGNKAVFPMSSPRIQANPQSSLPFGEEAKPRFRTKTVATRLTPDELAEIEAAAEGAGKAVSEWLRETALRGARQRPADPAELVLAELWAVRYTLLNLFHAAAQAAAEGSQLLPDSILKIRDQSEARKRQQAHKLLEDFLAPEGKKGGR
jgi:uncharacterized protein (DUF1778 family)